MEEKAEIKQVSEREIWIGENKLYLDEDNIYYIVTVGDIDQKIAIAIKEATNKLDNMVEGKVRRLINLNKGGKQSVSARKTWKELAESENIGKIALFGLNPVARMVAAFGAGLFKKKDMRFFNTEEEARAWLKE